MQALVENAPQAESSQLSRNRSSSETSKAPEVEDSSTRPIQPTEHRLESQNLEFVSQGSGNDANYASMAGAVAQGSNASSFSQAKTLEIIMPSDLASEDVIPVFLLQDSDCANARGSGYRTADAAGVSTVQPCTSENCHNLPEQLHRKQTKDVELLKARHPIAITRVDIHAQPYELGARWHDVILPRLYRVVDFIHEVRQEVAFCIHRLGIDALAPLCFAFYSLTGWGFGAH